MSYVMFGAEAVEVRCSICQCCHIGLVVFASDGSVRLHGWASTCFGEVCGKCARTFAQTFGYLAALSSGSPISTLADLKPTIPPAAVLS